MFATYVAAKLAKDKSTADSLSETMAVKRGLSKGMRECFEADVNYRLHRLLRGVDCDAFEEAITNYVQEYHNDAEDALNIVFQNRKYYDLVKMILAELKEKGITHIKLDE